MQKHRPLVGFLVAFYGFFGGFLAGRFDLGHRRVPFLAMEKVGPEKISMIHLNEEHKLHQRF
ncbi:MAG: hypothetical protein HY717_03690 [Planctomycetes bacterium]|nr:hypothetical protein [Planctomycetota bacterium]